MKVSLQNLLSPAIRNRTPDVTKRTLFYTVRKSCWVRILSPQCCRTRTNVLTRCNTTKHVTDLRWARRQGGIRIVWSVTRSEWGWQRYSYSHTAVRRREQEGRKTSNFSLLNHIINRLPQTSTQIPRVIINSLMYSLQYSQQKSVYTGLSSYII